MLTGGNLEAHRALEDPTTISPEVRESVLDRDNGQCQVCGTTYGLHLHHVVFRSQGGGHTPNNLVTLCFRDHEDVHVHRLTVELVEVWPDQWYAFWTRP